MVTTNSSYNFVLKNLLYDVSDAARVRRCHTKDINKEIQKLMNWHQSQLSHYKSGKYTKIDYQDFRRLQKYFEAILKQPPNEFDEIEFKKLYNSWLESSPKEEAPLESH